MNSREFQVQALDDPRLTVHATSALPAWLFSGDGTRILWSNPIGARIFGAESGAALAAKVFGPADQHRRQIARLAGRLPPNGGLRMERLRGFGAPLGVLATCACSRLDLADGGHGILVVAANGTARAMPLDHRLHLLARDVEALVVAFARDGTLVGASGAARNLPGLHDLSGSGFDRARDEALRNGRADVAVGMGEMVLHRVGSGPDVGLVAVITPFASGDAAPDSQPAPNQTATPEPTGHHEGFDAPMPDGPQAETSAEPTALNGAISEHEPSPFVEAVADETTDASETTAAALDADMPDVPAADAPASHAGSWLDEPVTTSRPHPLRFTWQMDEEGRFTLGSDEFTRLIGVRTAAAFGRPWNEIADTLGFDAAGRLMRAFATHDTWSGLALDWPVDGAGCLPVEMAGLPVFDSDRNFTGYRGFGMCRDLDAIARVAAFRRYELAGGVTATPSPVLAERGPSEEDVPAAPLQDDSPQDDASPQPVLHHDPAPAPLPGADLPAAVGIDSPGSSETSTDPATGAETPQPQQEKLHAEVSDNVVPFPVPGEAKPPSLTPGDNHAFNELARQLSVRLEREAGILSTRPAADDALFERSAALAAHGEFGEAAVRPAAASNDPARAQPALDRPEWLTEPEPPPRGETGRDRALLDLMPVGVLIYRLDRLLYANGAFLQRMGYASLQALEAAGGLDALYVEPGTSNASSTSDTGRPVKISANQPHQQQPAADAHLYTIQWDDDPALALIFSATPEQAAAAVPDAPPVPAAVGHADAEELGTILDTAADGVLMFDAEGNICSANRSAEALFGYGGEELVQRNLADLFAPESRHAVFDYLSGVKSAGVASLLDHGHEALGRVRQGGIVPLSITMGRSRADGPNFFAVFRDLSQAKQSESELREARRLADRAANARADMLARISHEVRTPLNAIIGFAEVMISERFGALGNARYVEYMKDVRASGERVLSIINDLLDLSRIETGKLDLALAAQNLNEVVEGCVAVMQPQANRERIIIRTSLAHALPPVLADSRALRQITLNLIGNSIHLAKAGGQVIVSTALSDRGEAMLRVRDTGHGLNENEVAAALEPFRTPSPSDHGCDNGAVNLSLTKALVEANHARFQIRTGGRSGTLIEVVFSGAVARA